MSKKRCHFTAEEKVALIRKHLIDKIPISELCDENKITASRFYGWMKIFFDNGKDAFKGSGRVKKDTRDQKIKELEAKIADRDEGIAELMMEHVKLKKKLCLN